MPPFADNLRRLMARQGMTVDQVAARSGLDERTVKGILRGGHQRPHARTLHRLAHGLGVAADELFHAPAYWSRRQFDRRTNPLVDEAVARRPELFADWRQADFDDLYSRFGTGGGLSVEGTLAAAEEINRRRALLDKVALLLETSQRDVLCGMIELLYRSVVLDAAADGAGGAASSSPGR